jgi:hypothetical protein
MESVTLWANAPLKQEDYAQELLHNCQYRCIFLLNITIRSHLFLYFHDNINATKTASPSTQHDVVLRKNNKMLKYIAGEFIVQCMRWDIITRVWSDNNASNLHWSLSGLGIHTTMFSLLTSNNHSFVFS